MKPLDKFLRAWRTHKALKVAPPNPISVLDIGCGDGYLLGKLAAIRKDGLDPALAVGVSLAGLRLEKGAFPCDLVKLGLTGPYDAIFALAVFEHLTEDDLSAAREVLPALLAPQGRLLVTVPHPFVDHILEVLLQCRLIDGQAVHEHHGFNPDDLHKLVSGRLRLASRHSFQLGLNTLWVFEKTNSASPL